MAEEKTILEWFNLIGDKTIRKRAIRNYNPDYQDKKEDIVHDLVDALNYGFPWGDSPEGFNYWCIISDDLEVKLKEMMRPQLSFKIVKK